MTETITRGYVLTPSDLEIIREKARTMGDASDSAALRVILREWAAMKKSFPSEPNTRTSGDSNKNEE